jgi:hypothetical protein
MMAKKWNRRPIFADVNIDVAFSVMHPLAGHFAGSTAYAPVNIYIDPHQLQSLLETLQAATLNSGIFAS